MKEANINKKILKLEALDHAKAKWLAAELRDNYPMGRTPLESLADYIQFYNMLRRERFGNRKLKSFKRKLFHKFLRLLSCEFDSKPVAPVTCGT